MHPVAELMKEWRTAARLLAPYAPAAARAFDTCAEDLTRALEDHYDETLTLIDAAAESGYSADHLGRLVRDGRLPNAGRPGAPRIRRGDLPRKTLRDGTTVVEFPATRKEQIVRSIVANEGG